MVDIGVAVGDGDGTGVNDAVGLGVGLQQAGTAPPCDSHAMEAASSTIAAAKRVEIRFIIRHICHSRSTTGDIALFSHL